MKRLSIIIPMYNVEPYVERCIKSLEDQDIPEADYEIICINDGSPDDCHGVVLGLQQQYNNIILIDQENQGVSEARNNGIRNAHGKFLLMIDPDDFVLQKSLNSILEQGERQDLEILYLGYEIFDESERNIWMSDFASHLNQIYDGVEGYFIERRKNLRDPDRSWAILFRRDLIINYGLLYPKDVPYLEDGLFLVKVSAVARRVGYHDLTFYKRTTRPGSATHSDLFFSNKATEGFIKAADDLMQFKKCFEFNFKQTGLINHGIVNFVLLSLFPLVRIKYFKRFYNTCIRLRSRGYKKLDICGAVEPYLSYAKEYNASPYIFALFYAKDLLLKKVTGQVLVQ